MFLNDGVRSIDFVCVWSPNENIETEESRAQRRLVFEENLDKEGLHLEREAVEGDLYFIKVSECVVNGRDKWIGVLIFIFQIHAPLEVLRRYSEILKLRMPMKAVRFLEIFYFELASVAAVNFRQTEL